jgi:hypothetical protein
LILSGGGEGNAAFRFMILICEQLSRRVGSPNGALSDSLINPTVDRCCCRRLDSMSAMSPKDLRSQLRARHHLRSSVSQFQNCFLQQPRAEDVREVEGTLWRQRLLELWQCTVTLIFFFNNSLCWLGIERSSSAPSNGPR